MATNKQTSGRRRGMIPLCLPSELGCGALRLGRRGIASLELAMALPVILLLLVALLTLGSSGTALMSATVQARNNAWRSRTSNPDSGSALEFGGNSTPTLASGTATQEPVTVSSRLSLPAANLRHAVLAGAWDFRELPMDKPLDKDLYARVGLDVASQFSEAASGTEALRGLLEDALTGEAGGMIKELDLSKEGLLKDAKMRLGKQLEDLGRMLTSLETELANLDITEIAKKFNLPKQIAKVKDWISAVTKALNGI